MLHAVHFTLAPGQKVGGVGVHGCGKTTLRIVSGDLSPDAGIVRWHDPAAQEEAHRCLTLQQPTKASSAAGLGPEERRLLRQLGLPEDRAGLPWPVLSGGQRAKLALARTLAQAGRLLLLDEPTNHLDVRSRLWLEQWLKAFKGAVILISHDRDFLDHTVARIDEISGGKLRSFPGNYTAYAAQKRIEWETAWREYLQYQAKRAQLERAARERMEWFRQAHRQAGQNDFLRAKAKKGAARAKAVERRLQKMEEKPRPAEPPAPRLRLETGMPIEAPWAAQAFHVSKSYPTGGQRRRILREVSFTLPAGAKVVLMGPNGSGKTTLLRLVTGDEQPDEGWVRVSPQARIGYLTQQLENLAPERTVLEEVLRVSELSPAETRTLLACLLFRGDAVLRRIASLSAGERMRVA